MIDDLAAANVNRSYSLAATSIAIFTFVMFFLYPGYRRGEASALLIQATLIVMGVATCSLAISAVYYSGASLGGRIDDAERPTYSRRGDRLWLLGYVLLLLAPSLVLFSIKVVVVAAAWFPLWPAYILFVIRHFPRVQTAQKS